MAFSGGTERNNHAFLSLLRFDWSKSSTMEGWKWPLILWHIPWCSRNQWAFSFIRKPVIIDLHLFLFLWSFRNVYKICEIFRCRLANSRVFVPRCLWLVFIQSHYLATIFWVRWSPFIK
jgi:hypothetical protein